MPGLLDNVRQKIGGLLSEAASVRELFSGRVGGQTLEQGIQNRLQPNSLRPALSPKQMVDAGMNIVGMAPLGMTVYHGSPHKFDKFDMSKIGTGEGAQAYGHGLYMAESPGVAKWYGERLPDLASKKVFIDGIETKFPQYDKGLIEYIDKPNFTKEELYGAFETSIDDAMRFGREQDASALNEILASLKKAKKINVDHGGVLYKVDIPDEAVSRMLDWDKPLSQQAPEVRDAIEKIRAFDAKKKTKPFYSNPAEEMAAKLANKTIPESMTGESIYRTLLKDYVEGNTGKASGKAVYKRTSESPALNEILAGIPGIRYLDGGSRTAGTGTSNFVLFDDQLPRILERNGVPTGLQPWGPGEWGGL